MSLNSKSSSLIAAAVASSVSSSETGVAADVELELSPPLDDAIAAEEIGAGSRVQDLLNPFRRSVSSFEFVALRICYCFA